MHKIVACEIGKNRIGIGFSGGAVLYHVRCTIGDLNNEDKLLMGLMRDALNEKLATDEGYRSCLLKNAPEIARLMGIGEVPEAANG